MAKLFNKKAKQGELETKLDPYQKQQSIPLKLKQAEQSELNTEPKPNQLWQEIQDNVSEVVQVPSLKSKPTLIFYRDPQSQDYFAPVKPRRTPPIKHKINKMYPQETKNINKALAGGLRKYIKLHFKELIPNNSVLQEFMKISEKQKSGNTTQNTMGTQKLQEFLDTSIGKQILQYFFGNYQWGIYIVGASKGDVEQFCRFNHIYTDKLFGAP